MRALFNVFGNVFRRLPRIVAEPLIAGLVALLIALPMIGLKTEAARGGLIVETRFDWLAWAVGIVVVGRALLVLVSEAGLRFPKIGRSRRAQTRSAGSRSWYSRNQFWIGFVVVGLVAAFPFAPFADRAALDLAIIILIYVMLGWGLNIVVGLAGLLDLGYVAFYAVGAYSFALFAQYFDLSFWLCLPLAGILAAFFGILLGFPVLRLRGDYLAIVTLGFGEIIRVVLINWYEFTNGPDGISGIPKPTFFGLEFKRRVAEGETFHEFFGIDYSSVHKLIFLFYVILLLALITNWFVLRLRRLPIGRAWEALREDEIACRSLGINPTNTKLSAFALGAMFGGFAGAFFATKQGFISPESFTFIESAIILAIVVLGGMGSQVGVVIAAIFIVALPELMRDLGEFGAEMSRYRMLIFGAAMVAIMVWKPRGLLSHREPTVRMAEEPVSHSRGSSA